MSSQGSKWEENIEHLIQLVKRCQIPHPQTATNYDDDKCTTLGTHRKSRRWRDGLLSNVVSQLHDTLKTQKILIKYYYFKCLYRYLQKMQLQWKEQQYALEGQFEMSEPDPRKKGLH